MIWIPYIIFQNTDDDEAVKVDARTEDGNIRTKVSVKRQSNFTRSGQEMADEVLQYISILHYNITIYCKIRSHSYVERKDIVY